MNKELRKSIEERVIKYCKKNKLLSSNKDNKIKYGFCVCDQTEDMFEHKVSCPTLELIVNIDGRKIHLSTIVWKIDSIEIQDASPVSLTIDEKIMLLKENEDALHEFLKQTSKKQGLKHLLYLLNLKYGINLNPLQ